jgi:hypothetical protein
LLSVQAEIWPKIKQLLSNCPASNWENTSNFPKIRPISSN